MPENATVLCLCNMKHFVYYICILLVMAVNLRSQTNNMLRNQAVEAERNKDWYGAAQYYNRLYSNDSLNIRIQYAFAEACRLSYDYDLALHLYLKIAGIDNGKRFPLTFYWIGQLLKNKEKYKDAKKWFVKFSKLKFKKNRYQYYRKKANIEIEACDLAQILLSNTTSGPAEHLSDPVNTKLSEYGAFEKDSTLYFSAIRFSERKTNDAQVAKRLGSRTVYSKIYVSEMKDQKFKKVKVLDTLINSKVYHNANTSFNEEETEMVISRCTALNASDYTCDLYSSRIANKKWSHAVKLPEPVNQPSVSTTQPNFGVLNGRTVLFFASNRPGGEGGLDIWYAYKNEDGSYEKPINAGKKINTPDDEITPWFVSDKNTLYFSSTWHKGLGGLDVFKSEFVNNEFTEPKNVGAPVNSSHNDLYYSVSKEGKRAYWSSNRTGSLFEGKLNCCNDIYRLTIDEEKITEPLIDTMRMLKEQMRLLVPLTLYFHNDEPDPKRLDTTTMKSYETTFNDYKMLAPQYIKEYSKGLKGTSEDLAKNKIINFFTDSVDAGLENLKIFSEMLEKVLLNGEKVEITLKGYCSPLASSAYNINLAKRRISSLTVFFKQYKNGVFGKYIDNQTEGEGKLIFKYVDVGELPASKVSDDLKDKRNSVYSPYAASERKIQIIAVSYGN